MSMRGRSSGRRAGKDQYGARKSEQKQNAPKNLDVRAFPSDGTISAMNPQKRRLWVMMKRQAKTSERKVRRKKRLQEQQQLGAEAPEKLKPSTLEDRRVPDPTFVDMEDEEIGDDFDVDEFASYFKGEETPKILITTSHGAKKQGEQLAEELSAIIPNSTFRKRKAYRVKEIIDYCQEKEFTYVVVLNEDYGKVNGMLVSHLPEGPTAYFRIRSVVFHKEIINHAAASDHYPELIMSNFSTRLGHTVGRIFSAIFPQKPEFKGRRVVTFHNQRDFIFFRHHRYVFDSATSCRLQEVGPRFTLKLETLQLGTFDSSGGEFIWNPKVEHRAVLNRRKWVI